MATTHNYTFDEISRIGNDLCISERDMQNNKFGSYLTQNHWASNCGMHLSISYIAT